MIPILPTDIQRRISNKLLDSFTKRKLVKSLIQIAEKGIENAIESNEEQATKWIYTELDNLEIDIK